MKMYPGSKTSPSRRRAQRQASIPAGPLRHTGGIRPDLRVFVLGQHAGFIVAQNILHDGGGTNATI
jgi:hypothetical protein